MLGRPIAALVGLLLSGCIELPVGAPVPVANVQSIARACAPAAVPPEYRFAATAGLQSSAQSVVDGAMAEWLRWGRQIVDYRAVDWARTRAVRDLVRAGLAPTAGNETADALFVPVLAAAGCWENDPRMFAALRAYWRPLQDGVPNDTGRRERYTDDLIDSALALSAGRATGWTEAWSAAFMSHVVSNAIGLGSFRYSRSHAEYVADAVEEFRTGDGVSLYVARPVTSFAPRPGDLICSYRNQPPREAWRPELAEWRLGPAHCDIVMAIEKGDGAGRLFAVGGNIFQSVSVSVHALSADGRLVDSQFRNWAIALADRANLPMR